MTVQFGKKDRIISGSVPDKKVTYQELQSQLATLQEFARYIIRTECWGGGYIDGGDVQELAEKLGLILPHTATEEDVDEDYDYEVGDKTYKLSEMLEEESEVSE